jgi:hypothetical protein
LITEKRAFTAGARVANDQVWAKPPGAAPITFHRDSTYFDFEPAVRLYFTRTFAPVPCLSCEFPRASSSCCLRAERNLFVFCFAQTS